MNKRPNFYKDRVALNILAGSVNNAIDCYQAANGYAVLGVLTNNYSSDETAIEDMKLYQDAINNAISIGLGAGDPNQSEMVKRVSQLLHPQHINQVFTGVGKTREILAQDETFINCLVSPTGKIGLVNIATGPLSSTAPSAEVPIESAIAIIKDMGGSSIKFFPMKGLEHEDEYRIVAQACAKNNFNLEPTGGIDINNFETILKIALEAGVPKVIPHIYSSIIDKKTGLTKSKDVQILFNIVQKLLG
ncbi:2-dehydro-3-deoxyphosphooctonate aldolase [Bombilactobacillus bombi]|uniref:2-dehydro-3-deoxyphosphooctonate aldolase n=1 Tax=Bombilactobacillus bombi TaxID=1303590 RepID=A0A417Z5I8_9LACO|nr:KDGP aldolase family protein [Bombilactobacillus bombi]RHW45635.1 2-dehydro-3-deoxyphosphooctonate aldolase [Bombilactobacillus bombi]